MALGTPYLVGSGATKPATSSASLTFSVTTSTVAGDAIVVGATQTSQTANPLASVTDSKGNTYTASGPYDNGTFFNAGIFTCLNSLNLVAGTDTITVTFTTADLRTKEAGAVGCSGVLSASAIDQYGSTGSTGSTTPSLTLNPTAQASELVVAWETNEGIAGPITWSAGWVQQAGSIKPATGTNAYSAIATQVLTSTGAVTASGTLAVSGKWDMLAVTLKAGSGTPSGSVSFPVTFTNKANGFKPGVSGVPYLIGGGTAQGTTGSVTVAVIPPSQAVARGDCIVVAAGWPAAGSIVSISDTQGNVYNPVETAGTLSATIWRALNVNPLNTTTDQILVNLGQPATGVFVNVIAAGCSGILTVAATDQAVAATGTSTAPSATSGTLAQANEVCFGVINDANAGGFPAWAAGWTVLQATSAGGGSYTGLAYKVVTATTAVTANATITSAGWTTLLVTAKQQVAATFSGAVSFPVTHTYALGVTSNVTSLPVDTFRSVFCMSVTGFKTGGGGGGGGSGAVTFPVKFGYQTNHTLKGVNTYSKASINNYGITTIPVTTNTPGNALLAFIGWNPASNINPVSNVADDAHNFWQHIGTSPAAGTTRCSVWIAPNAQAVQNVSVGMSWFTEGLTITIVEFQNFPVWANLDAGVTTYNNNTASMTLSSTATTADFAFACLCGGNNLVPITHPASWNTAGIPIQINDPGNAGGPADTSLAVVWNTIPAGPFSATFTTASPVPMSGIIVAFKQVPTTPLQKNPNWPAMHVEMAMGYTPGDPSVMPAWTDVTARLIGTSGQPSITSTRGRQYESATPEAGDLVVQLDNHDGALTPGNIASPYYPNVKLGTPVRVWATWQNRAYAIAAGYTERDPQTWPDAQYGQVPWEAVDALGPLSNSVLPSAFAGELLMDSPYGYWPCGETYQQSMAAGQPLANLSRSNQRPMICEDAFFISTLGVQTRFLQTGLSWTTTVIGQSSTGTGLLGDGSTAIGTTVALDDVAAVAVTPEAGAFYRANDMPQATGNGLTVEFWATIDKTLTDESHFIELLRLGGPADNYYTNFNRGARLLIRVSPSIFVIDVMNFQGDDFVQSWTMHLSDGLPHHFAVALTVSGGNYVIAPYIDGNPLSVVTSTGVSTSSDINFLGAGAIVNSEGGVAYGYNYQIGHIALFNSALSAPRIEQHYNAAVLAGSGETTLGRIARLLVWGGLGMARAAAPPSPSPILGPADQTAGQSVADAASNIAATDGGMFFVDAANNVTWWPRTFLYNRSVKWTFGDGAGEIPYDPGEQYDYDNTFISNVITAQRVQSGSASGALFTVADTTSQKQYFTRTSQQAAVETTSDEDAIDQANWALSRYKQPALRVQQVKLNPAANTTVFAAALGVEQGDIVQLNRRPLGGAVISQTCIVQLVAHNIGPDIWETTINMIPYTAPANVLTCDTATFNVVGNNGVGW